ncbi:VanZ family protein [Bacillus timonensis]|uniref:VanZ family protein n=1 Tax=Bacillus timonensis TaxID=1033734 RepID=UPI0002890F4A|nr:VanZ family protein [Bacillus timonensis]
MQLFIIRFILRFLPVIYMVWIWLQSSHFNPSKLEGIHVQIGIPIYLLLGAALEIGHLFQFAILYALLVMAFLTFGKLSLKIEILLFAIAVLYGVLDEIHQFYVPFRSFSITDLIKDGIGVIVVSYIIHKKYFNNEQSRLGRLLRGITVLH